MDDFDHRDTERVCTGLAIACYTLMDLGDYEAVAALFCEDATWVRGGTPVSGRTAILAALQRRPTTEISRHLITNVMVTPIDGESAEGTAYFVPLRGPSDGDGGPSPMPRMAMVGDLVYRFRREAEGWRIAFLEPRPVFKT